MAWEAAAPRLAPEPNTELLDDEPEEGHTPDGDTAEEAGEQDQEAAPVPRGYITLPDLRPYVDPRPLAALGPLATEAARNARPPLVRALHWCLRGLRWALHVLGIVLREVGRMLAWYGRGIGVILVLLVGWLSGKFGERGSIGARAGAVAAAVYVVVKLTGEHPITPWVIGGVALLATVMAATGHIEVPESKPAKKDAAKGDNKKKGAVDKSAKAPAKGKAAPAESAPEETPKVSKEKPARSWKGRLRARHAAPTETHAATPAVPPRGTPAEAPAEPPAEPSEEPPGEVGGEAAAPPLLDVQEVAAEASPGPSREDLIRGLHHLYRGGSGVLHTALAQHLALPDTRALKRVLDGAGIPYREGVRTPVGNGPGTHHEDIPPLPFPQGSPQGGGVAAGQSANANANNTANAPGEGLSTQGNEWTPAERKQGFRIVPNPEGGPAASRVERWNG
ncbi:hypothetical protein [Streptomyces anulatus]|uniref:hypothetical protein n=1 Tax=Streptomyces anulatus TaxID=1892 RepID=UPI0036834315